MLPDIIDHFKEIYRESFEHLKNAWPKLLAWTAGWFILYTLFQNSLEHEAYYASILNDLNVDHSDATVSTVKSTVLGIITYVIGIFMTYSLFGLAMQTKDDPDANWLKCGTQGVLKPLQAIRIGGLFEIVRIGVLYGGGYAIIALPCFMGDIAYVLFIIFIIAYFYFLLRLSMSWFNFMDYPEHGAMSAIAKSYKDMKGRVGYMLIATLPVILLVFVLSFAGAACEKKQNEAFNLEIQMAKHAVETINTTLVEDQDYLQKLDTSAYNDLDVARLKKAMANKFYDEPVPDYNDYQDVERYVKALAEYGSKRDAFEANRDNREIAGITEAYLQRSELNARWAFLNFICNIALIGTIVIGLALVVQFYRMIERLPARVKTNTDDPDIQSDEPELLRDEPIEEQPTPKEEVQRLRMEEMPSFSMDEIKIPEIAEPENEQEIRKRKENDNKKTMQADLSALTFSFPESQKQTPQAPLPSIANEEKRVSQAHTPEYPLIVPTDNDKVIDVPSFTPPQISDNNDNNDENRDDDSFPFQVSEEEQNTSKDPFDDFFKPKIPKGPANIIKR